MENPLKLKRIHHVEFWVGNAQQAALLSTAKDSVFRKSPTAD